MLAPHRPLVRQKSLLNLYAVLVWVEVKAQTSSPANETSIFLSFHDGGEIDMWRHQRVLNMGATKCVHVFTYFQRGAGYRTFCSSTCCKNSGAPKGNPAAWSTYLLSLSLSSADLDDLDAISSRFVAMFSWSHPCIIIVFSRPCARGSSRELHGHYLSHELWGGNRVGSLENGSMPRMILR